MEMRFVWVVLGCVFTVVVVLDLFELNMHIFPLEVTRAG